MARVPTSQLKGQHTKACGRTTSNLDQAKSTGLKMAHFMRVSSSMAKKKVMDRTPGPMVKLIWENGLTTKLMVSVNTLGRMAGSIMGNGMTITWMELAFIDTLTV